MVTPIYDENHIALNNKVYAIKPRTPDGEGGIRRTDISQFPAKLVMGDTTYDDEPVLSNWIISDQRGGIGKEYASPKDLTKCLWSTCDLDHEGHILPPPLATALTLPTLPTLTDGGVEIWASATNLTNWTETLSGGGAAVNREATTIHGGTYSAQLLTTAAYSEISQTLSGWSNNLRGATVLITAWCKEAASTSVGTISIYDGVGTTTVNITQDNVWNNNLCFRKLDVLATEITVKIRITWASGTPALYVDDVAFFSSSDVNFCYENFNGGTYQSKGSVLYRVDSSTGAMFLQAMLPKKITSLKATVGTNLAIGQGDSNVWYYLTAAGGTLINGSGVATGAPITLPINRTTVTVTTAGTFTVTLPASGTGTATTGTATVTGSPQALVGGANTITITGTGTFTIDTFAVLTATDKTGCHFSAHWNNLFCYVNTSGQFYSTGTLAASPTIATKGKIGDGSTLNNLEVYHDTALAEQVYCGTSVKTWVHDWTNAKWYPANIKYASHPNAGKGMVNHNLGLYISMGIHVKKYSITSGTASADPVGLDKDGGSLPIKVASTGTNYIGEFTSFIDDNDCFYGTVDSTQYGTNGYSWVAKYTGLGWQVLWSTTTLNQAMYGGIVGSIYTRRLYFDCGATLYSIPLPRVNISPKQISTSTYAASAIHVSPWFNGGSQVNDKLAQAIKTFCKDITTAEKVTVYYRTDRTYTDLDTGWGTALVTLDSTGENNKVETALASGVGVSCNLIQLRFDLVTGTSTLAPDLQSYSISYQKWLPIKGSWSFTVVAESGKQAPREIETNLLAARASVTLVKFNYRDGSVSTEEKNVRVLSFIQRTPTGTTYTAEYDVTVIEL